MVRLNKYNIYLPFGSRARLTRRFNSVMTSSSRTADVAISIISTGFHSFTYSVISETSVLVGRLYEVFAKQVVGKLRCSMQAYMVSVSLKSCMVGERTPRVIWEDI